MNCIITQLNHISTIPNVLSRKDGYTIFIKMSVLRQTRWLLEQHRLRRLIWYLPTLYSETETTPPSQLEILTGSVEIHFTELLLFYQSFVLIIFLFFSP